MASKKRRDTGPAMHRYRLLSVLSDAQPRTRTQLFWQLGGPRTGLTMRQLSYAIRDANYQRHIASVDPPRIQTRRWAITPEGERWLSRETERYYRRLYA